MNKYMQLKAETDPAFLKAREEQIYHFSTCEVCQHKIGGYAIGRLIYNDLMDQLERFEPDVRQYTMPLNVLFGIEK